MQVFDSKQNSSINPYKEPPVFSSMLVTQEIQGVHIPSEFQQTIKLLAHNSPCELIGYFTGVVENGIFHAVDNCYLGRSNINSVMTASTEELDPITRWKDDFKLISLRRDFPYLQTLVWHSRPFTEIGPLLNFSQQSEDFINQHYSQVKAGGFKGMFNVEAEGLYVNSTLKDAIAFFNNRRVLSRINLPPDLLSNPCDTFMELAKICRFVSEGNGAINISHISLMENAINHTLRVLTPDDIGAIAGPQILIRPWPGSQENCEILPYGKANQFRNGAPDLLPLTEDRPCHDLSFQFIEDKLEKVKKEATIAAKSFFNSSSRIDSLTHETFKRNYADSKSMFLNQYIFLKFENCAVLNDWVETIKNYSLN